MANPSRRGVSCIVGFATIASVVAVLFLVSCCVVVPSVKQSLGTSTTRRLADKEEAKYDDSSTRTLGYICESQVLEERISTRPTESPELTKPDVGEARCIAHRKREREEDPYGPFADENDEYCVRLGEREGEESRDLQKLPENLPTLSLDPLDNRGAGSSHLKSYQLLEQYIEEVLAADEAGLSLDAWLLDPTKEMPSRPASSELQRTSEESSNDEDDGEAHSSAAAPTSFEGGTSLSGVMAQHFLEGLLGPSGSSVPSSEATKSREGSRVLQASTLSHDSQFSPTQQHSQLVNNDQTHSHPLEQYIEEVLAADEAGLSLDAWLLDPTKEMPSRPSSSELQRTSEESSNDEDDEEAHSSAAAPTSFEGGTSLS
ncbi:hypothetical protein EAH_00063280, partial [Eimeria acervulina]